MSFNMSHFDKYDPLSFADALGRQAARVHRVSHEVPTHTR